MTVFQNLRSQSYSKLTLRQKLDVLKHANMMQPAVLDADDVYALFELTDVQLLNKFHHYTFDEVMDMDYALINSQIYERNKDISLAPKKLEEKIENVPGSILEKMTPELVIKKAEVPKMEKVEMDAPQLGHTLIETHPDVEPPKTFSQVASALIKPTTHPKDKSKNKSRKSNSSKSLLDSATSSSSDGSSSSSSGSDDPKPKNFDALKLIVNFMNKTHKWWEHWGGWGIAQKHVMYANFVEYEPTTYDVRSDNHINSNIYHAQPIYSIIQWESWWIIKCFGTEICRIPFSHNVHELEVSLQLASQLIVASNYSAEMNMDTIIAKLNACAASSSSINIDRNLPLLGYHIHRDTVDFVKNIIMEYFYNRGILAFRERPGLKAGRGHSDILPEKSNSKNSGGSNLKQKFGQRILGICAMLVLAVGFTFVLRYLSVILQLLYQFLTARTLRADLTVLLTVSLDSLRRLIISVCGPCVTLLLGIVRKIINLWMGQLMYLLKLGSRMLLTLSLVSVNCIKRGIIGLGQSIRVMWREIDSRESNHLLRMNPTLNTNIRDLSTAGRTFISVLLEEFFTPLRHIFSPPPENLSNISRSLLEQDI